MTQVTERCGDYTVYLHEIAAHEKVEFSVREPNNHLATLVSASLLLDGPCVLDVRGEVFVDGKAVPYSRTDAVPALVGFDTFRQDRHWVSSIKTTMTAPAGGTYVCVSVAPRGQLPVSYFVADIDGAVIPTGALFVPTVAFSCNGRDYAKHTPYVNDAEALTLAAQGGKLLVVQKA